MPDPSDTRISWWRLALLAVVGWQASVPLRDSDWGLFGGITFGVHELGHLVSMGGEGDDHDWSYLLRTVDLLEQEKRIAGVVRGAGWVAWGGALLWGLRHGARRPTRPRW